MDESVSRTTTHLHEMSVPELLDVKREIFEADKPFPLPLDEEREVQLIKGEIISRTVPAVPHTDAQMALGLAALAVFTVMGFLPQFDGVHSLLGILVAAWIIVHKKTLLAALPKG